MKSNADARGRVPAPISIFHAGRDRQYRSAQPRQFRASQTKTAALLGAAIARRSDMRRRSATLDIAGAPNRSETQAQDFR